MPAKNSIKDYRADSYYHAFNRGVEKRKIFLDKQDFKTFLNYLKIYLSPRDDDALRLNIQKAENWAEKDKILGLLSLNNFSEEIDLLAYCLMPNHFHLLLKQKPNMAIKHFMQSLTTKYSMYFNRKYKRIGSLFQGIYKAVLVKSEEQLVYLSKYIHQNPKTDKIKKWKYSSLPNYYGEINQIWVKPNKILNLFSLSKPKLSYWQFINETTNDIMLMDSLKLD